MKGERLKLVVIILMLSCFITLASAGNVVFRDGKIISSGNVSTDEKFVGDGSQITNLSRSNNNEFNQSVYVLGNASNSYNFATLELYQNATAIYDNPVWQITHRSETLFKNSLIFYYFNGSSWFSQFRISPSGNIGMGTSTPSAKLDVNGSGLFSGNVNASHLIGDGSQLTNITTSATNPFNQNLNTTSNVNFNNLTINDWVKTNVTGGYQGGDIHLLNDTADSNSYNSIFFFSADIIDFSGESTWSITHQRGNKNLKFYNNNGSSWVESLVLTRKGDLNITGEATLIAPTGFDVWQRYYSSGSPSAIIQAFVGSYLLRSIGGKELFFSNTNFTNNFNIRDNDTIRLTTSYGFEVQNLSESPLFSVNKTLLNSRVNIIAPNITSNHQTYNITATTSLDTTYTNNLDRPIYVDFTFQNSIWLNSDLAYITLYVNGTYCSREGHGGSTGTTFEIDEISYYHLGCYVQPSQKWSLNSTVGGSGSVTKEKVYITAI